MFADARVYGHEIDPWLAVFDRVLEEGSSWEFILEAIQRVLSKNNTSQPGPGGIPFLAYKRCKYTASLVIKRVLEELTSADGQTLPDVFSQCDFRILPKSPDQVDPEGRPAYSVGKTSPIIISHSIMRILDHCILSVLTPKAIRFIGEDQRGFAPGRIGLDNILALDEFISANVQN